MYTVLRNFGQFLCYAIFIGDPLRKDFYFRNSGCSVISRVLDQESDRIVLGLLRILAALW